MDEIELERKIEVVEDVMSVCDVTLSDGTDKDEKLVTIADELFEEVTAELGVEELLSEGPAEDTELTLPNAVTLDDDTVVPKSELDVKFAVIDDDEGVERPILEESPVDEVDSMVAGSTDVLVMLDTALLDDGDEETRLLVVEEVLSIVEDWLDTVELWLDGLEGAETLELVPEVKVEEDVGMVLLTLDVLVSRMELLDVLGSEDDELVATGLLTLDMLEAIEVLFNVEDRAIVEETVYEPVLKGRVLESLEKLVDVLLEVAVAELDETTKDELPVSLLELETDASREVLDETAVDELPISLLEIEPDEDSTVLDDVLIDELVTPVLELESDEAREVLVDGLPKLLGRTEKGAGVELELLDIVVEVTLMIVTVLVAAAELLDPSLLESEVELAVFELGPRKLNVDDRRPLEVVLLISVEVSVLGV